MHTSGPWNWKEGQGVITKEWNGFPWPVATVDTSELGWHEDDGCKNRENGANARLIAAAPDLLEACEAILKADADYSKLGDVDSENLWYWALDKLREAVKKAKGGAT